MTIDPTRPNDIRSRSAEPSAEVSEQKKASAPVEPAARTDQVEISEEARELARQAAAERVPVTETRLAEIRDRLESGFYDRPDVRTEIAERLVDSGDL